MEKKNKCDPAVEASKLKSSRGPDGEKLFPATSMLSQKQQVASFSRARSSRSECRKLTVNTKTILEKEDIVDALVEREQRESMREKVFQDVDF